jgi:metal-sulfur cluster biosynthetic enzyme
VTTEAEVREVLNEIVDPCSITAGVPAGLCDMGLIRAVQVSGGPGEQRVGLTVGVTEPGCFMIGPFAAEARARLLALPGVGEVELELDNGYDWTESMMAPAYRARLTEHRARESARRRLPLHPVHREAG